MDAIVTVSNTSKNFFAEHYGVKPERITVCYNGVGFAYTRLDPLGLTAHARLGAGEKFVFHLSRFSERKNPWTILEGFRRFVAGAGSVGSGSGLPGGAESRADYKLVIGGKGWDIPVVRNRIAEAGLEGRVILAGFLDEKESVELFNAASVFVFPSLAEGFGMPNVEAMACGCPVITSNVFAIPEVVGDAALVLDDPLDADALAAAIEGVLFEPGLREKLVEAGQRRLPAFSWDESAEKVMGVYEGLTRPS
jgi:glycosyltransferase involved in cell wall biosynthesis